VIFQDFPGGVGTLDHLTTNGDAVLTVRVAISWHVWQWTLIVRSARRRHNMSTTETVSLRRGLCAISLCVLWTFEKTASGLVSHFSSSNKLEVFAPCRQVMRQCCYCYDCSVTGRSEAVKRRLHLRFDGRSTPIRRRSLSYDGDNSLRLT